MFCVKKPVANSNGNVSEKSFHRVFGEKHQIIRILYLYGFGGNAVLKTNLKKSLNTVNLIIPVSHGDLVFLTAVSYCVQGE